MFEVISSVFSKKSKIESLIEKTKSNVEKRNKEFDFDLLGRSLSLNPYPPRAFDFDFSLFIKDDIIKLKCIKDESSISNLPNNLGLIIADTTSLKDISLIATLRRYTPFIIIHKDIIISKYQILESAIYGADMIILDSSILDFKSFEILFNFCIHLGIRVVVDSSIDIPSDIFSNIDFMMIDSLKTNIVTNKIAIYIEN
ncbi:hypothetical protein [Helicobacter sp. MIT 99-5507]|uniref:hypothetical protein n=1 Tax=Helicobacter sp. MIT 99-5507 TaxID=152489 RepID=UPI000E1F046A|nr:hypothetical protein [Helicobacter sp. MIT 99-5507]RDU57589.1 hypothetical protein CQA42_06640 [Helicobacter sp. MIT 99-5507]